MYEVFANLLKQKGVKVIDVARETGISNSMFSDWKAGRYTPKTDKLEKIASYFGVSVDYLLTGRETNDYYLDEDARELAQFLFENPDYRVLFDATRKVKREDLQIVKELLDRFS